MKKRMTGTFAKAIAKSSTQTGPCAGSSRYSCRKLPLLEEWREGVRHLQAAMQRLEVHQYRRHKHENAGACFAPALFSKPLQCM